MTFEEVWREVKGLPEVAKIQVPGTLSADTKQKLTKHTPEEVAVIVATAIEEVNHGSVFPLDILVKKRL